MADAINRRYFLQGSLAATAGAALTQSTRAAESPSNKVVVGAMGMGGRGRQLAQSFAQQPGVELRYVCEVDSNRLSQAVKQVEKEAGQSPTPVVDVREILDDSEVDVLVCAAPNHWHAPATILACDAGKHVYVEKPCSHNAKEGELMVEAARKHNRAVQMGVQRRSGKTMQEAIARLHEGVIGKLYCSRAWYNNLRGSIGNGQQVDPPEHLNYELWQGPAPRVAYTDNRIHYNWHWFWHWGNGELGNNGVHSLDICRWGLQVDHPIRVTSSGGRYRYDDDQQTPDTHVAAYEFDGEKAITWQGLSCNRHDHGAGFVAFYGEGGAMDVDSSGGYRIYDEKDKLVEEVSGQMDQVDHFQNFLTAVREDKPLSCNAEIAEGHKSTLMCHLGNIAYRTGHALTCRASDGHIIGDEKAMALWDRDYASGWQPVV